MPPPHFSFASQKTKLLCLKGQTGTVACRVHNPLDAKMLPTRSQSSNKLRYAFLSAEKMGNLTAVRGSKPGKHMVGPCDFFDQLDRSDLHLYTFDVSAGKVPVITSHPLSNFPNFSRINDSNTIIPDSHITKVDARWFSGFNKTEIRIKKRVYGAGLGGNLFPNSGILEISGPQEVKLAAFDPRGVDLSAFKARLVPNNEPFQITAERLYVDDEYCVVSYQFDAGYAEDQIQSGGGIFLEFHQFAQTITPLDSGARGFVTLAKWNEQYTQLELIAIQIPFGYTLIVEKDCIHGDATLDGLFMMCMTSDHISMGTADTVFLKHDESKKNIRLTLDMTLDNQNKPKPHRKLAPLVLYKENKGSDRKEFNYRTQNMSFIFTPTPGYLEVKKPTMGTVALLMLGGACLLAAIFLVQTMLILSLLMLAAAITFTGIGLFSALKSSEAYVENNPELSAFNI